MLCPRCEANLETVCLGEAEAGFCRQGCGGAWFDWAQLARVDDPDEGFGAALEAILGFETKPRRDARLSCTRCQIPMQEHRYDNLPGVLIDECYGCRGLFLDPGELSEIRKRIGDRAAKAEAVRRAILTNPVTHRFSLENDRSRERGKAVDALIKTFTRKYFGFLAF